MDTPTLIISGSIAIDRIMNFSGRYQDLIHQKKLDVLSVSVLVDDLKIAPGGIGANIAYSHALLGNAPILLGSVGPDGREYMDALQEAGVDIHYIHSSTLPTASFSVLTDAAHNQVGGFYPGAMADAESLSLKPWAKQNVFVCISAHDPAGMRRQVDECKKMGLRLLYDPGQQVNNISGEDIRRGLAAAELVIVNEYEHSLLCEKTGISEKKLCQQLPVIVTTKGADGILISGSSVPKPLHIHAAQPKQIVDPTGAGDAFRAGFLHGYLRQWDLIQCGQLGTAVASLILESFGPRAEFTMHQVAHRYVDAYHQSITLHERNI